MQLLNEKQMVNVSGGVIGIPTGRWNCVCSGGMAHDTVPAPQLCVHFCCNLNGSNGGFVAEINSYGYTSDGTVIRDIEPDKGQRFHCNRVVISGFAVSAA